MAQQILSHTPYWVWGILALLVGLGVRMMKPRQVSARQLTMLPLVMTSYSLVSLYASFGAQSILLPAWGAGVAIALAIGRWLISPANVRYDTRTQRFSLPGSVLPLLLMLSIFGVKFVIGFAAAQVPMLMTDPQFVGMLSLISGLLSGGFLVRCLAARALLGRGQSALRAA
jgi:hypothetical protein